MSIVISVENLSKHYDLGKINTGTLFRDFERWLARLRKKPDPYAKIGHDVRQVGDEFIWALQDISFKVKQGEVLGIIGRNGAGKSTLLKILSRVTAPTSGQIKIKGRIASLLEVGTGFHPELTGRENIYMNGAILGMRKKEITRKLDEIVAFSEVEKFIDTPVKRYSSGMYVRLAFSVAAYLEPEILVVDEVLAVGDAGFQKKCLGKMESVGNEGRTVLFVSHNMAAIESLCQTGIVLNQGAVSFIGSQTDAIKEYFKDFSCHNVSLREVPRGGSGQIRIVNIELRDIDGHLLDVVQSGQDMDLYLYYETRPNYTGGSANPGFAISTQLGVTVFEQSSRTQGLDLGPLKSKGAFICRIKRLPLPPSTYQINIFIKVMGEYVDVLNGAVDFTVVEGAFFPSINMRRLGGVCLVDGEWHLENNV